MRNYLKGQIGILDLWKILLIGLGDRENLQTISTSIALSV